MVLNNIIQLFRKWIVSVAFKGEYDRASTKDSRKRLGGGAMSD